MLQFYFKKYCCPVKKENIFIMIFMLRLENSLLCKQNGITSPGGEPPGTGPGGDDAVTHPAENRRDRDSLHNASLVYLEQVAGVAVGDG